MTNPTWLAALNGQTIVVKFGGNAMVDDGLKRSFAQDVVAMAAAGVRTVVVHGGGPQISAALEQRGIPTEFRGGLRVTTPAALEVVRETLAVIGDELARLVREAGGEAQALSGEQRGLFAGRRRSTEVDGESINIGLVGDVVAVEPTAVLELVDGGGIPIVSSISPDADTAGQSLNVNADAAAASLAVALHADRLVILTDVPGLYRNWPDRDSLVTTIDTVELAALVPSLESGMIPKIQACLAAVLGGVGEATIVDGRVTHPLLAAPFGETGTTVVATGTQAKTRKATS